MYGGWADAHTIRYILTEQGSEDGVAKERGIAHRVDPVGIHYHRDNLDVHVCMYICICVCK